MDNQLLTWRKSATTKEWEELARKAGTSIGYLNLIAYGYRNASPKLAVAIESASKTFTNRNVLTKESLVFTSRLEQAPEKKGLHEMSTQHQPPLTPPEEA